MASLSQHLLVFGAFISILACLVSGQRSNTTGGPWLTLSGQAPLVIAKGGFSGLFPDSSYVAYAFIKLISLPNVIAWCDVQLTKDAAGVCLSSLLLDKVTSISGPGAKEYNVNGVPTNGHFTVDYNLDEFQNIFLMQATLSRSERFDLNGYPVLTVEDMVQGNKPPGLWLNIQHDAFFTQHNLSMRSFVLSVSRRVVVSYVSSPEVAFLRSIVARLQVKGSKTKLIFRFLDIDQAEPSTNQTYGSLLKNLTFIKTFSSGILVPKNYIWPVNSGLYLQPHTTLVADAHREGLEVFASDFANDISFSYNYSYDPVAEYLSFIDNGDFSVDGVLSEFPMTPSEAIGCFSHVSQNSSGQAMPTIISHNGASGVYPDCTDLAYNQAVTDGADYIDCTVQMTSDGIPVCLSSINLIDITTVPQSPFGNLAVTVPEIQETPGIFTFNLTWKNIQSLKPVITSPAAKEYRLVRSPAHRNAGSFLTLDEFLELAKSKQLMGILISVENAAYLAEKKGMSITDAVLDALSNSGYNNQTAQEVIIQSTDKAVLTRFKEQSKYKLMYKVDEDIRTADDAAIEDIKSFAKSVAVSKKSVFPQHRAFIVDSTNIVSKLQSFNLTVYVYTFMNEYIEQAWDFFSDPVVEINTYVKAAGIDGIITDFPGTAAAYRRNKCLTGKLPPYMTPVGPGSLLQLIVPELLPPAQAPYPVLTESDVAEGPLPPVSRQLPAGGSAQAPNSPKPSNHPRLEVGIFLSSLPVFLASLWLL